MEPNFVFTATQPGGGSGFVECARFAIEVAAIIAIVVQRGQTASVPVNTVQNNKPHQPMAGKRIPAASTGDAQPMIPSGGMTLRRIPTGARQSACFSSRHQTNAHGSARSAADANQSTIAN